MRVVDTRRLKSSLARAAIAAVAVALAFAPSAARANHLGPNTPHFVETVQYLSGAPVYGADCVTPCTVRFGTLARDVGGTDNYVYPPAYLSRMEWDFDIGMGNVDPSTVFTDDANGFDVDHTFLTPGQYFYCMRGTYKNGIVDYSCGRFVRVIDPADIPVSPQMTSGTNLSLPQDLQFSAPTTALAIKWTSLSRNAFGTLTDIRRTGPDPNGYYSFAVNLRAAPIGNLRVSVEAATGAVGKPIIPTDFSLRVVSNSAPPFTDFVVKNAVPLASETKCSVGKVLTFGAIEDHKVRYQLGIQYRLPSKRSSWRLLRRGKKTFTGGFGVRYYSLLVDVGRKGASLQKLVRAKARFRLAGTVEVMSAAGEAVYTGTMRGGVKLGKVCKISKR